VKIFLSCGLLFLGAATNFGICAVAAEVSLVIHSEALHNGRIDPKLFGNFVELLDDVVPGMWAELLNDRSFEGVIPAANWCYYDGSLDICDRQWDTNRTWRLDSDNPFNGSRCARITADREEGSLTQSGLAARKDMAYRFSGYLRGTGKIEATVLLKCQLPAGDWMTLASKQLPGISSQWHNYAAQMNCRGETDRAVFELRVKGKGVLWADKLSLMPSDNQSGWRSDVVEAVKEVKPSIIRWGGSSVDPGRYHWKEGIGDRDLRVPWRNKNWGRIDPNDVGIDEFCQFCELTGCEPLVCVSFADGAASAGALVEYCNGVGTGEWSAKRAANGHVSPCKVKYWQIGNEIEGDNAAYLEQIPGFIAAMKKVDPEILIMSSFPHQTLLERVGKELAFVCPHHYTPDLQECDRDLTSVTRLIETTPGCAGIQIGVTEWNIDAGSWGLGRGKQATLGAALMNARYLHVLMRHSERVKIACRSNLANSYCGAIIETGIAGQGILRRPSYYVMKLYARHSRPVPLQIEASDNGLDVFACSSEDRRSGAVFAINPKPEAVAVSLEFKGIEIGKLSSEAVSDNLNAGQPDVMNHWRTPERVNIVDEPISGKRWIARPLSATVIEWGAN
jgi:alpha-N-arabinofuranosidase